MSTELYNDEYEALQQRYEQLRREYESIQQAIRMAYQDPELRPHLKAISKRMGLEIDDPPQEKRFRQEIESLKKELEERDKKQQEEFYKRKQEEFNQLLREYGISEEEYPELQKFISETGIMPSNKDGWRVVLQNYRRSKMVQPTYVKPTFKNTINEDFMKNPEEAFYQAHLRALRK